MKRNEKKNYQSKIAIRYISEISCTECNCLIRFHCNEIGHKNQMIKNSEESKRKVI